MRPRLTPVVLLASAAALLAGCTGQTLVVSAPSSSTSLTTTPTEAVVPIDEASGLPERRISTQAFRYGSSNDPETMFADASIVAAGVTTEVSPAR